LRIAVADLEEGFSFRWITVIACVLIILEDQCINYQFLGPQ